MTETQVKISVSGGLSDMIPNQTLAEVLSESLVQQGGPDFTQQDYELAQSFLEAIPEPIRKEWVQKAADAAGEPLSEFEKHPLDRSVAPFDPALMNLVVTGSSDVGDVSRIVPTPQVTLTATVPGTSPHTWQFTAQVGTPWAAEPAWRRQRCWGLPVKSCSTTRRWSKRQRKSLPGAARRGTSVRFRRAWTMPR